jgi:NAD(P)-dependent dehydrogenase (short-subunit alcohol dehydrogenase family)
MKVIVVGASGTIGKAIFDSFSSEHEVIRVGNSSGDIQVDISSEESISSMFDQVGNFDALVCAAGLAKFGKFSELSLEDFMLGFKNKLMGQVNLVRIGSGHINKGGSFTLTSGVLSKEPIPGSTSISMVNAGLEAFVRALVLDNPNHFRVNVVSPIWVKETMEAMGMDSSKGMPAANVALAYKESVESERNGEVLDVRDFS